MSRDRILDKVLSGSSDRNIRFQDLFDIINLQPLKDGKSKSYQVRQVRNLFLKYKFHIIEE